MSPVLGDLPTPRTDHVGCGGDVRPSRRGKWRAIVLIGVHVLFLIHLAHWKLTGESISPLEPSEAQETMRMGFVNAGFVLLVVAAASTMVFGRFFCGWGCHWVFLQDACAWLLGRFGLRPKPIRSRLLVFIPIYAALDLFVKPLVERIYQSQFGEALPTLTWHLTADDFWATFPGWGMGILTVVVSGILIVWMLGAKGFCTYGCPYGAVFAFSDRFSRGRIRVTDDCEACGHCTSVCTSNVRVHEEVAKFGQVIDPGCLKCTDCVSVCPKDALYFGFGNSRRAAQAQSTKKKKRLYDFTWPEELAMAAVFAFSMYAFRGLYGAVSFLLALGMAALSSVSIVVLWRMVKNASVRMQHYQLRSEGRLRAAGVACLAIAPAYLLFTAHSAIVRFNTTEGERLIVEAAALEPGSEERAALIDRSIDHLMRVRTYSLVQTDRVSNQLGQALFERERFEEAEEALRDAIRLAPDNTSARVYLTRILLRSNDIDGALDQLEVLLSVEQPDAIAVRLLFGILNRFPDSDRALFLYEKLNTGR